MVLRMKLIHYNKILTWISSSAAVSRRSESSLCISLCKEKCKNAHGQNCQSLQGCSSYLNTETLMRTCIGIDPNQRTCIANDIDCLYEIHATIEDIYVASVDSSCGTRKTIRVYDTAALQGNKETLPRHYLHFPDGYVVVYDPNDQSSLDMLASIKIDIDKHK